jgi:hypothetical protein
VRVAVLVPRRADGGRRDEIWQWVEARLRRLHPHYGIFEGHHDDGPFNRSMAINRAAAAAGDFDVAVIADSDSFIGAHQMTDAVDLASRTHTMVLAYDRFCYLSFEMSNRIMSGYVGMWEPGVEWTMPGTCSSMVVVTHDLWDECEGFDEGFVGWGGEDIAFSHKAQTFGRGLERIPGPVWHLHHPTQVHADAGSWVPRIEAYAAVSYDPTRMRELMAQLKQGADQ